MHFWLAARWQWCGVKGSQHRNTYGDIQRALIPLQEGAAQTYKSLEPISMGEINSGPCAANESEESLIS